jgi:serine/threonine-protein kinase
MTQARLVGGRYELGELIGYGGMAEVHRGRDVRLGRDVAIKVLRADLARDPSFLNRFRREAQAAAGLNHPSIVAVYDTGEDVTPEGGSLPFIVMEFVQGRTLRDVLKTEGRLPPRRAMEIAADVCGALDFSHRNGIVHRDIKPANVMITQTGAVKVMDFGIARALADNAATVTQTANVIGTAQYLSPEQARGEAVDARSDVYSTGCLLYELATGSPPFQGDSPVAVAYQHVRENAAAPSSRNPQVPPALDSIVMKALAKNQLNRYQSAGEMRTDLQRALADQPVAAEAVMTDAERTQFIARTPVPPVALAHHDGDDALDPDADRRRGLIWLAIVVALLLVIGGIVAAILLIHKTAPPPVKSAAIPNVIGMSAADATNALKDQGFATVAADPPITDVSKCVKKVDPGQVCTVTPAVGTSTKVDTKVTYSLFTVAMTTVPPVTDIQYNDAVTRLQQAHLVAAKKDVDDSHPAGYVLAQDPAPYGAPVPEGTTVTLSVSTGKVVLADVRGKPVADAVAALNAQQFTNTDTTATTATTDQTKDGTVADENPTPGIAYPTNTLVKLTIYKYVAPTTSAAPSLPNCGPNAVPSGTNPSPTPGTSWPPTAPTCVIGQPTH